MTVQSDLQLIREFLSQTSQADLLTAVDRVEEVFTRARDESQLIETPEGPALRVPYWFVKA